MKKFTEHNVTEKIYHYESDNTWQIVLTEPNTGLEGGSWAYKDLNNDKQAYIAAKKEALESLNSDVPELIEFLIKRLNCLELAKMLGDEIVNTYVSCEETRDATLRLMDLEDSLKKLETKSDWSE